MCFLPSCILNRPHPGQSLPNVIEPSHEFIFTEEPAFMTPFGDFALQTDTIGEIEEQIINIFAFPADEVDFLKVVSMQGSEGLTLIFEFEVDEFGNGFAFRGGVGWQDSEDVIFGCFPVEQCFDAGIVLAEGVILDNVFFLEL
jgi:hypothetical protein